MIYCCIFTATSPVPSADDDVAFLCPFTNVPVRKIDYREHLQEQLIMVGTLTRCQVDKTQIFMLNFYDSQDFR